MRASLLKVAGCCCQKRKVAGCCCQKRKVAGCRPGSSLHLSSSAAARGGIGSSVGAPLPSSVTSGTDGMPNCSMRFGDGGGGGAALLSLPAPSGP